MYIVISAGDQAGDHGRCARLYTLSSTEQSPLSSTVSQTLTLDLLQSHVVVDATFAIFALLHRQDEPSSSLLCPKTPLLPH